MKRLKYLIILVLTFQAVQSYAQGYMITLTNGKTITIRADETEIITFTADKNIQTDLALGREAVDLGLSVKWANMNIGATEVAGTKTNSHTGQLDCYGEYYAWGETTPKDSYDWSNYTLCNGSSSSFNSDDAAHANWGGSWRMPTHEEQTELRNNCYWEWTTSYNGSGVAGYIVYKAKNSSDYTLSDTHIFLPASGSRDGGDFLYVGTDGDYWSGSLQTSLPNYAYGLYFGSDCTESGEYYRYRGLCVRAVCP